MVKMQESGRPKTLARGKNSSGNIKTDSQNVLVLRQLYYRACTKVQGPDQTAFQSTFLGNWPELFVDQGSWNSCPASEPNKESSILEAESSPPHDNFFWAS